MTNDKRSHKDLLLRVLEIWSTNEVDSLDEVFDKDTVVDWPQSGERARGLENMKAIVRHSITLRKYSKLPLSEAQVAVGQDRTRYLLTPMFTTIKIEETADKVVATARMKFPRGWPRQAPSGPPDPDGSDWFVIILATFSNGKIVKLVQYFAPVHEAPVWRSQWVEPIEGDS